MHWSSLNSIISIIILFTLKQCSCFEPITMGVAAGVGALGYYFKDYTYCKMYECCNDESIPGDTYALMAALKKSLYGQHIVVQHVIPALSAHMQKRSRKPLVISFHGTPGTGKNFVSDMIAKALYTKGTESKFVHKYLGRADFPRSDRTSDYQERITREVRSGIAACERSLFIFDEVDKMPPGVFDALTSVIDYNYVGEKAIFVFLSNTAGLHISDHLGKLMKTGTLREETKLKDFEPLLQKAAYNLDGGLQKTSLIESHVIDHYIPFLPLEKAHVVQCIIAEFNSHGVSDPSSEKINSILESTITYERQYGMFATSGCKTLEKKVAMAVMWSG